MVLETLVHSREQRWFLTLCLLARTEMVLEPLVYSRKQSWFSKRWCTRSSVTDAAANPRKVCVLILLLVNNIKMPPVLTEAVILLPHKASV